MFKLVGLLALIVAVLGFLFWSVNQKTAVGQNSAISTITGAASVQKPEENIISKNGIHWHAQLNIYIKGELQTIPPDVGLGSVHLPIHTHDADNIIHMEFSGLVKTKDTALKEFFKIWGKQFNSNCIFDNCNSPDKTVKMFVNGKLNNDFEKYLMQNNDEIEIRYE